MTDEGLSRLRKLADDWLATYSDSDESADIIKADAELLSDAADELELIDGMKEGVAVRIADLEKHIELLNMRVAFLNARLHKAAVEHRFDPVHYLDGFGLLMVKK